MKIHVHKRSGKFIDTFEVPNDGEVLDLKEAFYKKYHYYPERQWYNIGSVKGPVMKDGSLASNGVQDGTAVYFKDLGIQISWRLVFVVEYIGPLFIVPILWNLPSLIYGVPNPPRCSTQKVAFALIVVHFLKREFESLFVHRFSNGTMPATNLLKNCFHYWIICGLGIGYFLCHPLYRQPFSNPLVIYAMAALFLLFEYLNFRTHLVLRGLRTRGTKERGIPKGWGFDLASCANYFWETMAWLVFSLLTMCFTSWFFTVVAFGQMMEWALKKHRLYVRDFPDYPKKRKAVVPFVL